MNDSQKKIFEELSIKYFELNKKKANSKNAKKNHITLDGLKDAIASAIDDLDEYEPDWQTYSEKKFLQKLEWYVKRASYYYTNKPLTFSVSRSFDNISLPYEDRLAAAGVGFLLALNTFNPDKGNQFSTYAWRVMSNEIIATDKKRSKAKIVKQKSRNILATENGTIFSIELSQNSRKVIYKGHKVDVFDIHVYENNFTREHVYEYLYEIPETIKVGSNIKIGQNLGMTAGVETEVSSMDWMMDNDEHGDINFSNPLDTDHDHYDNQEKISNKENIMAILTFAINSLSKREQLVITNRFLLAKKKNRAKVAAELQMTEYAVSKTEKAALKKLQDILKDNEIGTEDITIFS